MPGFDGTGPRGEGPMTGGGRGYCAADLSGGKIYGGGRGRAWGGGRGWGRGMGRGFGRRSFAPQQSAQDERACLADQLSALESELREIKGRLEELDKNKEE